MRRRSGLVLVAAAALLAGSAAHAGTLISATWTQTIQGVDLTVTNSGATCTNVDPNHVQQTITCPGTGLGATGSSTASTYSASLTMPLFSLNQFTTTGVIGFIPLHTKATLSGAQFVTGSNSAAGASMGVPGGVTVKAAGHLAMGVNASMLTGLGTEVLKVQLSVGVKGSATGYVFSGIADQYFTVDFYAWTPHTLTFTGLTSMFAPLPDAAAMGSFGLTPMGGGTVTLVSPSRLSIDHFRAQRRTVSLSTLKLTYAPEPGMLLLLGAAAAGLVLVERRRHR